MFDLEQAIAKWRRQMRAAGLKAPGVLDELEGHLREATAEQMELGRTASEAFALAVQRLGPAEMLRAEFARVCGPDAAKIRKWMAVGYSAELVACTALQVRFLWKSSPSHGDLWLGIVGLAVTLLAAHLVWRLAPRIMNTFPGKGARALVVIGCSLLSLAWMAVYAWFILPCLDFTPGQFAVAFLWALLPMLAVPALMGGIVTSESRAVQ